MTVWKFDSLCLPPKRTFSAEEVQRIWSSARGSQTVFAAFLGVGKTTVRQWEQGLKKPSGPAAKPLDLVDRKGIGARAAE